MMFKACASAKVYCPDLTEPDASACGASVETIGIENAAQRDPTPTTRPRGVGNLTSPTAVDRRRFIR